MKKRLPTILLCTALIVGLSLLLYPTFSDWWNSYHQTRAIADYAAGVAQIDTEEYDRILQEARDYNASLTARAKTLAALSDEEEAVYTNTLDVSGTGIMGYINIPKINVNLPIYHGTSESVLQVAVGHLEGSSLPVGGESTHCVLSGHRGLPSATLFTHLDKMEEGDEFILTILDEVLTYEVDQIRIVLPSEVGDLGIVEGQDYCTLVTCTPYGINSHRLLVRGHRVENEKAAVRVSADAVKVEPILVAPLLAAPVLLALIATVALMPSKKRRS